MFKPQLHQAVKAYIPKSIQKWGIAENALGVSESDTADAYRHMVLDFQNALAKKYPETSRGGKTEIPTPFESFSYSYQRVNLEWQGRDWLNLIHGQSFEDIVQAGSFKRSGMASVENVLTFISSRQLSVQSSPEPYYETLFKMRRMSNISQCRLQDEAFGNDTDVLFLDTSSRIWPKLPSNKGKVKFVVVDTACIEARHPLIIETLHTAKDLGIGVIFIRSHMKLDCFGLDINTLGSALAILPNSLEEGVRDIMDAYSLWVTDTNQCDDFARVRDLY